jgi:signal peptidase
MASSGRPVQSTVRRLAGALLLAGGLLLGLSVLVPALLGYQRYVITSGSMTGAYDRGSLVFDRVVPTASLRVGDVITFRPPGHAGLVTHRLAKIDTVRGQRVFVTRGDANRVADAWSPMTLQATTQARVAFHLPYLGFAFAVLSDRRARMLVIGLPALLIALAALAGMWQQAGVEARAARTR